MSNPIYALSLSTPFKAMAVVGHNQIDTTNHYLRKAGVDLKGVTNELGYSIPKAQVAEVISLATFRGAQ